MSELVNLYKDAAATQQIFPKTKTEAVEGLSDLIANINTVTNFTSTVNTNGDTVLTLTFSDGSSKSATISNPVNFKIVGGETQPTSPTENTIWVNTSTAISGYTISGASTLEQKTEGWVHINATIGAASGSPEFNALKKNEIFINPKSVKQYIDSQWTTKEVKIYQNDQWASLFDGFLFNYGSVNENITGGWEAKNVPHESGWKGYPTATAQSDGSMLITMSDDKAGIYVTKEKIDLSNYSIITFVGYVYDSAGYSRAKMVVWSDIGALSTDNEVLSSKFTNTETVDTYTLDVSSLTGEYYIGFRIILSSAKVKMCSLKLS